MNDFGIREFGTSRENEERRDGGAAVVFDPGTNLFAVARERDTLRLRLFSGGVEQNEDMQEGILREVEEEGGLYDFDRVIYLDEVLAHYHNSLKNVNRVAYATCFLVILRSTATKPQRLEEHEPFDLVWVSEKQLRANWDEWNTEHGLDHWVYFLDRACGQLQEMGFTEL